VAIDYDVSYNWTRGDKTGWTKIGHAFINPKGRSKICLDANPIPGLATNPGELVLFPKLPETTLAKKAAEAAPPQEEPPF